MNKEKQKLEQQAAELREKLEELENTIKELPSGDEKWVPNMREGYWHVTRHGNIYHVCWDDDSKDRAKKGTYENPEML